MWKDGVPQDNKWLRLVNSLFIVIFFFFVLCLAEITFIPDLMIMKIQKKEKQVCDPFSFSRLSWQGLGTVSCV